MEVYVYQNKYLWTDSQKDRPQPDKHLIITMDEPRDKVAAGEQTAVDCSGYIISIISRTGRKQIRGRAR